MYLVYADESGDYGFPGETPFVVISGLIVHEQDWNQVFHGFLELRRNLRQRYHIPQRLAFHAFDLVNGHGDFHHSVYGLTRQQRMDIYREALEFLSQLSQIHILNVFIRKRSIVALADPDRLFDWAWRLFIQRIHNSTDRNGHLCRDGSDFALLLTDRTHDDRLRALMRRMRAYNPIPSAALSGPPRTVLVTRLLDDPMPRESAHSYFIQMADLVAYALARRDYPRDCFRRFGLERYFDALDPVLLKEASQYDAQGIVYWPRDT